MVIKIFFNALKIFFIREIAFQGVKSAHSNSIMIVEIVKQNVKYI